MSELRRVVRKRDEKKKRLGKAGRKVYCGICRFRAEDLKR